MNILLAVATHKKYWMPENKIYFPVQAGRENKESLGYAGDNTGDNISTKNSKYSELTVLYWAWKNVNAEYIGLVHYRRYFSLSSCFGKSKMEKRNSILTSGQAELLLKKYEVIVPKKRKYYIETNESHYIHAHREEDLELTRQIIQELYPDYSKDFECILKRNYAHMYNMFIMSRKLLDTYCEWLFNILFEFERRNSTAKNPSTEPRIYGFLSEILLDVWLLNQNCKYAELNVVFMENPKRFKKAVEFLCRKFFRKPIRWPKSEQKGAFL